MFLSCLNNRYFSPVNFHIKCYARQLFQSLTWRQEDIICEMLKIRNGADFVFITLHQDQWLRHEET